MMSGAREAEQQHRRVRAGSRAPPGASGHSGFDIIPRTATPAAVPDRISQLFLFAFQGDNKDQKAEDQIEHLR